MPVAMSETSGTDFWTRQHPSTFQIKVCYNDMFTSTGMQQILVYELLNALCNIFA